jgi:hypothetical protein
MDVEDGRVVDEVVVCRQGARRGREVDSEDLAHLLDSFVLSSETDRPWVELCSSPSRMTVSYG